MPKQYVLFGRLLPPITTRRITILLSAVFIFAVFSVIFTLPAAVPTGPSLSKFADHIPAGSTWSTSSLNPFGPKPHAPPRQKDDSHEDSSWFSDWKWLSTPFSSSFTLDENRALLPPLPERPPIYCYYDVALRRDRVISEAESALLLTWRRAWWAQGFRPILLSAVDAVNNPRFEELQRLKVTPAAKADIMRWLAWENMGGGLLSQYLVLPMGAHNDPLLSSLRRGEYPQLTRWEGLSDGLFAGSKEGITNAIKLVLSNPTLVNAETFLEAIPVVHDASASAKAAPNSDPNVARPAKPPAGKALTDKAAAANAAGGAAAPKAPSANAPPVEDGAPPPPPSENEAVAATTTAAAAADAEATKIAARDVNGAAAAAAAAVPANKAKSAPSTPVKTAEFPFVVEKTPASIAFYDAQTVAMKYTKVGDTITRDRPAGLHSLNQLINAHLHIAWQNLFSGGIAVLKPRPQHTTHMIEPGMELATRLAQCSASPHEASCPPNMPKCEPCVARHPMRIRTPPTYHNVSALFTVGTVPHPYTFQSVAHKQAALDVPWLRRKSERDAWLFEITKELLGTGVSGRARVLKFKQAVADEYARSHTLLVAAEQPLPADVDWQFGFAIPALGEGIKKGESKPPVPGSEHQATPPTQDRDDGPVASTDALVRERDLLVKAKQLGISRKTKDRAMREAVEAWNLADTEAWKFARAYLARAYVERETWEKEEARYSRGAGSAKGRR